MAQVGDANQTKRCSSCGFERPTTDFRRRNRDSEKRHSQCRECFNESMRLYRASRREREIAGFARHVIRRRSKSSKITLLCREMTQRFGGVGAFAELWWDHMQTAMWDRPGSKPVLDSFRAIVRLAEVACDIGGLVQPSTEDMSDEELERELIQSAERVILQNPELAVVCARRIGWTVVPSE